MADLQNEAAWLEVEKATTLVVRPAPFPVPSDQEVVIQVAYAAVNPADWKFQVHAYIPVQYPFILGIDVAGIVVQIGSRVTKFSIGQRVLGHCHSLFSGRPANSGFQRFTACRENLVSAIPDSLPLANAAVLPLGVDTAASMLYRDLKLPLPRSQPVAEKEQRSILFWGGSSSVGSCAIQLATASGLRVLTTAGPSNVDYVRRLGAAASFDHRDPDVVEKILRELKTGDHVVDCIGEKETQESCNKILSTIGGGILPIVQFPQAKFDENVTPVMANSLAPGMTTEEMPEAFAPGATHVGKAIWHEFMPAALQQGRFQAKPDPFIIRGGLADVQQGVDLLRKGVSAKKIVIEIDASL